MATTLSEAIVTELSPHDALRCLYAWTRLDVAGHGTQDMDQPVTMVHHAGHQEIVNAETFESIVYVCHRPDEESAPHHWAKSERCRC